MNIIDVNEKEFNDKVVEASTKKLIIVDFWAPWCGPCKQLTPILEKTVQGLEDRVTLAKINIDDNQQIAAQLRIQSIPTVYAFKDKQIANAFQGVLPENQIIEFIEKCLGTKISEDFTNFYEQIENSISEKNFEETKNILLEFISNNPKEIKAIGYYLECLIELKEFGEVNSFVESLEDEIQEKEEIKKIIKKMKIIETNQSGPSIDELIKILEKKPNDIGVITDLANKYFSEQSYENCMELLLQNYPKNKDKIKEKMIEFFGVLGDTNKITIEYRKKLSRIMFS